MDTPFVILNVTTLLSDSVMKNEINNLLVISWAAKKEMPGCDNIVELYCTFGWFRLWIKYVCCDKGIEGEHINVCCELLS